jgi:hypothetical protein
MTNAWCTAAISRSARLVARGGALVLALLVAPALMAQTTVKPAPVRPATKPPPTRPVLIVNPNPGQRFNQQMRQQKLQGDLRRGTIQQQLRQKTADTARAPFADYPALQRQADITDRARDANARMRQQSLLDQYRDLPRPAPTLSTPPASKQPPASARSGD